MKAVGEAVSPCFVPMGVANYTPMSFPLWRAAGLLFGPAQSQTRRMYWRRASIQDGQASTSAWWRHCSETVFSAI